MKKLSKIGLLTLSIAFLVGAASVSTTNAQTLANKILSRMDAHQKELQSLKANIAMEKGTRLHNQRFLMFRAVYLLS